jgi:hypothetical protein
MFEDISTASVSAVVSESEGVAFISICPPWVGRSSWSSSVSIVGGLLRMSFGCRARVWRVDLFSGHLRDVAICGPPQFAHFASWCLHCSVFLLQPSTLHLCFAPSCPSAQIKHFASSTHLPKWSRPQQCIHILPSPLSQNLSATKGKSLRQDGVCCLLAFHGQD